MSRFTRLFCVAVLAFLAAPKVQADDLLWTEPPPVSNNLGDANYFDNTTATANVAPTANDILFIGAGGNVTQSTGTLTAQKLRIGNVLGAAAYQGAGTVTVNNGAKIDLTLAGSGASASVIIGGGALATASSGFDGTLNIDGANSNVTSAQLVQIGFGDQSTANATVNITNGGSLVVTTGDINLGSRNGSVGSGVPGHLNISGAASSVTISTATADLNVGQRAASSYVQSDGTASIGDQVNVGQNGAANSTFNMTGGTLTAGGAVNVGQNTAQNASFTMSGGTLTASGAVNVGQDTAHGSSFSVSGGTLQSASVTIGDDTANNVTGSFTGNAVINIPTNNLNIGLGTSQNASLLVADNAAIHITNTASSTGNVFLGRATSTNATLTMTGGTIDTGRNFLMGSGGGTNIVGNQSGGTITTTLNFTICDTGGGSTYNLSGTGAIVSNGLVIVGRQTATGTMNQTGGSVTAALGVQVAAAQNANTSLWGTGIYNVSGGTITANQIVGGTALAIAPQGNDGTFRVIGDDATIDVNGDMTVNAGGGAQGTLAYQLETGDLLSMIDVSGTARFNKGAKLVLDDSLVAPTQTSYDLLTAPSIADIGISFTGPAGWGYQIVSGGSGKILRVGLGLQPQLPGDHNNDGTVDAADYIVWRKTPAAYGGDPGGYEAYRQNFGNPSGSGSSLAGSAVVPEPAVGSLLLMALVCLAARIRPASRVK